LRAGNGTKLVGILLMKDIAVRASTTMQDSPRMIGGPSLDSTAKGSAMPGLDGFSTAVAFGTDEDFLVDVDFFDAA
jgi:hypothetical protein